MIDVAAFVTREEFVRGSQEYEMQLANLNSITSTTISRDEAYMEFDDLQRQILELKGELSVVRNMLADFVSDSASDTILKHMPDILDFQED